MAVLVQGQITAEIFTGLLLEPSEAGFLLNGDRLSQESSLSFCV
jgi:hypothetical protein